MDSSENSKVRPGPPRLDGFDYSRTDVAYFVTIRAHTGAPFAEPAIATMVVNALTWLRTQRDIRLYTYCLMPDHLHLLLQLPERPLDVGSPVAGASVLRRPSPLTVGSVMATLKSFTTRQSWDMGHEGPLWQLNYYDHILRSYESGLRIAEYILANPARKGLVERAEDYAWSGMPDPL